MFRLSPVAVTVRSDKLYPHLPGGFPTGFRSPSTHHYTPIFDLLHNAMHKAQGLISCNCDISLHLTHWKKGQKQQVCSSSCTPMFSSRHTRWSHCEGNTSRRTSTFSGDLCFNSHAQVYYKNDTIFAPLRCLTACKYISCTLHKATHIPGGHIYPQFRIDATQSKGVTDTVHHNVNSFQFHANRCQRILHALSRVDCVVWFLSFCCSENQIRSSDITSFGPDIPTEIQKEIKRHAWCSAVKRTLQRLRQEKERGSFRHRNERCQFNSRLSKQMKY
jgi:hypothetical protein